MMPAAEPRSESLVLRHRRPRIGFLGVGWIGRKRLLALRDDGAVTLAGIADTTAATATAVALESGCDTVVDSLDQLLDLDLDGLVISTPSAMHAEQSEYALERGVAVFCQKPLARTLPETERIVAAAERADRLLGVDFSYRTIAGVSRIRELIRNGTLGRIFAADLVFHNAYGPDKPWFYDPVLSGGGCVIDLGVHLVDLLLWMLDYPPIVALTSRIYAKGVRLDTLDCVTEDYATAELELSEGRSARLACSWRLSAGCDAVISAEFHGTEGSAALRNVNGSFVDFTAHHFRGTGREQLAGPPDAWGGRAACAWARRLATHPRFDPEARRYLDVARVIDAIYGRDT